MSTISDSTICINEVFMEFFSCTFAQHPQRWRNKTFTAQVSCVCSQQLPGEKFQNKGKQTI